MSHVPWKVTLLPGGVLPAGPAYRDLLPEVDGEVEARATDLEVYATDAPPEDYSLDLEVMGIDRVADEAGAAARSGCRDRMALRVAQPVPRDKWRRQRDAPNGHENGKRVSTFALDHSPTRRDTAPPRLRAGTARGHQACDVRGGRGPSPRPRPRPRRRAARRSPLRRQAARSC